MNLYTMPLLPLAGPSAGWNQETLGSGERKAPVSLQTPPAISDHQGLIDRIKRSSISAPLNLVLEPRLERCKLYSLTDPPLPLSVRRNGFQHHRRLDSIHVTGPAATGAGRASATRTAQVHI
ncbi:hypothetical protein NDU88_001714 [Pleurodeles waltl]|uniref:Uncharacterized protein n=1 Tax=Pleurodeles waltl TaxID=8319 RepID=A0AAV7SB68_PLEWA|nr:hypothetical protein NDU88_001714 [Pleurodeles waltl]